MSPSQQLHHHDWNQNQLRFCFLMILIMKRNGSNIPWHKLNLLSFSTDSLWVFPLQYRRLWEFFRFSLVYGVTHDQMTIEHWFLKVRVIHNTGVLKSVWQRPIKLQSNPDPTADILLVTLHPYLCIGSRESTRVGGTHGECGKKSREKGQFMSLEQLFKKSQRKPNPQGHWNPVGPTVYLDPVITCYCILNGNSWNLKYGPKVFCKLRYSNTWPRFSVRLTFVCSLGTFDWADIH